MSVTDLILQAKAQRANEVLFVVGSEPKMRTIGDWRSLSEKHILASDWGILVQTLLNAQQNALLDTLGYVSGETAIGPQRVGFSFYQSGQIMRAMIYFANDSMASADFSAPNPFVETIQAQAGLSVFVSSKISVSSASISAVLSKINDERAKVILVMSTLPLAQLKENKALFLYHQIQGIKDFNQEEIFKGVDLVVIHGSFEDDVIAQALRLSENGISVLLSIQSNSSISFLRRAISSVSEKFGDQGVPRLADALQVVCSQTLGTSANQELFAAYEYMLIKPHIRQYLANGDIKSLDSLLRGTAETLGVQTLNQSLVQLLVRRKIDLKTAFEVSREPDLLDQQLKKLGV